MDTGIRLAGERDIPALTEIWKICFHDTDEYIRFFYGEFFSDLTAAVYTVDDRPVSMLHWMESTFVDGEKRQSARFLYAGGTLPEYRSRGFYGALFRYATGLADLDGCALFGKPACREIIPYYRRFGFEPDACFRLVTVAPGERLPLAAAPLGAEEYNRMRDRVFSARPYAKWPDAHVRRSISDNAFFGGRTLAFRMDGEEHFLMGAPRGDTLVIAETSLNLPQLERVSGALCAEFGTSEIKAYLPDYVCGEGEEIVSSIVYNAQPRNTYVNLILL